MPLVLPPVPMDEYLAALFRKDTHAPHWGDEVVLSHAVSRGVEQLTPGEALLRIQERMAAIPRPLLVTAPYDMAAAMDTAADGALLCSLAAVPTATVQSVWPVPIELAALALCRTYTGLATVVDQHIMMLVKQGGITYDMVAAPMAAKMSLSGMGHAGRILTLSPLEVLLRVHIILGHAPLHVILATLSQSASLPKNTITKEAIKE